MASVVALIGVSGYRDPDSGLAAVPQAARSVDLLASALARRLDLVPPADIRQLLDPGNSDEMGGFVGAAAEVADDLLLIYYCGHGLVNSDGRLALTHTRSTVSSVDYQALEYEKIRRACRSSPARRRIVILDCCYSGGAIDGALAGEADLRGPLRVPGSYVLTSSPATEPSRVRPDEVATAFTGRLVTVLTDPVNPVSDLNTLVARLRHRLEDDDLPTPQVVDNNHLGEVPLFRVLPAPDIAPRPEDIPGRHRAAAEPSPAPPDLPTRRPGAGRPPEDVPGRDPGRPRDLPGRQGDRWPHSPDVEGRRPADVSGRAHDATGRPDAVPPRPQPVPGRPQDVAARRPDVPDALISPAAASPGERGRGSRRRWAVIAGVAVLVAAAVLVPTLLPRGGKGSGPTGPGGTARGKILAGDVVIAETTPDGVRVYPFGEVYAAITGYRGRSAAAGLEQTLDGTLGGKHESVVTTIKPAVQQAAAKALGDRAGAVVALDATTGAILALVSSPSYNPEAVSNTASAAQAAARDENRPLLNRTTQAYTPGTAFTFITAAAALEAHPDATQPVQPATHYQPPGSTDTIDNLGSVCPDNLNLLLAVQQSCTAALAQLAVELGGSTLRVTAAAFGLGQDVPDLHLPQVRTDLPQLSDGLEVARSAIGQRDIRVTPVQMAAAIAAVPTDGMRPAPYLIAQTPVTTRAMSKEIAVALGSILFGAAGVQHPGLIMGGKVGLAETQSGRDAWFVGYSNRIAVAVVLEKSNPRSEPEAGRQVGPIAVATLKAAIGG
jgi:peptidoglycan glycosyltransferase